ncbi:DNA cytosine methyltransferase [Cellulomonas algicola]|uniref:DNA cytosine methyltransferase n=1 Tax=Cellulomonas algicola TaxID=2071633 RepID=UPI001C3FDD06|nr:DNA cytosine methyltransferase [Cellulomonas algicola]
MTTSRAEIGDDLTVLDLFAGAGGLSAGVTSPGGFRPIAAVEMDRAAAATYRLNHPDTDVFAGPIQEWLDQCEVPEVDVIVGGPPCQGFSTLGKQDEQDERNALWYEYAKTIVRAQPRWFVVENVATFVKSAQFWLFRHETTRGGMLADWTFEARVVNAADHGSFQARKRALLIGHRRDVTAPPWPVPEFIGRHRTVAEAIGGLPDPGGDEWPTATVELDGEDVLGGWTTDELHIGRRYRQVSLDRFAAIPPGGNRFDLPEHLKAPCWVKHTSGSGDVMGRLRWDAPSVTIRTEFYKPEKGRYLHPVADRVITHREAAILQGFPSNYRWAGTRAQVARQIGNAVPHELGAAVGRALLAATQPDRPTEVEAANLF